MSFSPTALHTKPLRAVSPEQPEQHGAPHWAPSRFASLGDEAFTRLSPTPLPEPYLVAVSARLARELGFSPAMLHDPAWIEVLAGNRIPQDADPLATVYSGHQFGVWAGQLGDGRAILLGILTGAGKPQEVQLKGAGRTPYSRMGDGRAVLRSSIREFLCSEAMAGLGIPTTRALSIVGSDFPIRRETVETAAVVARVAPSFLRFGHFEHFSHGDQHAALQRLADHVIDDFYPQCRAEPNPTQALLREVTLRTAELVAAWQAVGFCHGVMNTDNMSILGLTIDYGPFGFLDGFDAHHVCNHSDTQGRYAYHAQPQVAHWNLFCLAQALLPLLDPQLATHPEDELAQQRAINAAQQALDPYREAYGAAFLKRFRAKLGLVIEHPQDADLLGALFEILQSGRVDFTHFFRRLGDLRLVPDVVLPSKSATGGSGNASRDAALRDLFVDRDSWDRWVSDYRARLTLEPLSDDVRRTVMNRVNPKYVLRNHLAELAIRKACAHDFSEVSRLLDVLSQPFEEQPESEAYAALPPDWAGSLEISCSS